MPLWSPSALAVARLLASDRREQRTRPEFTVERERLPRSDERHPQRLCSARVELLRGLGQEGTMLTSVRAARIRLERGAPMHHRVVTPVRNIVVLLASFFLLAVG